MEAIDLPAGNDSFIMNEKSEAKKTEPVRVEKHEQVEERKKRLAPAKNLKGNVAKIIERGRLMGF